MEDYEIIFNDNEPEIKVSIDKTYSMRDFKKCIWKFLMKFIESNTKGIKENEF